MEYIELNIKISPRNPWAEILVANLADAGYESFVDTEDGILAYGQASEVDFAAPLKNTLLENKQDDFDFVIEQKFIPQQNWNAVWEADFQPVFVEEYCTIKAPFHEDIQLVGLPIIIQPQMSFGTGHHQTTYLMSKSLFELDTKFENVLDMGTGTGVLAIIAEKLGAKKLLAVDIEDWSVENTKENLIRNHCVKTEVICGDIDVIPAQKFDLILANINKNVLKAHARNYSEMLSKGGKLFISGFFTTDVDEMIEVFSNLGMEYEKMLNKDEWACVHFSKN